MDSARGSSSGSPRRRRFGPNKPAAAAAAAHAGAWLHQLVYMLIGGAVVYVFLRSSGGQQQQQQHSDGIVRLAAIPDPPADSKEAAAAAAASAFFRVSQAAGREQLCSDTCFKAKDGVCDDGRFLHNMTRGLPSTVLCDVGTDCSDCGPWQGVQHSSAWQEPVGPIEFLRLHNLTVLTKRSAFEPRFHFAFTDPTHDVDASRDFAGASTLEQRLSHIAYHILHGPCQKGAAVGGTSSLLTDTTASDSSSEALTSSSTVIDGSSSTGSGNTGSSTGSSTDGLEASGLDELAGEEAAAEEGLVLDVGAGFGWYSLMAGMLGCRVIAWEPVKVFQAYMEYSIARNKLQHKVEVRAAAVVASSGFSTSTMHLNTTASIQQVLHQRQHTQHTQQQHPQQQQQRKLLGRFFTPLEEQQEQQQQKQQQQGASAGSSSNVTVVAPTRGMWGTASIEGRSIHLALSSGGAFHKYDVPAETLDAVVLPLVGNSSQQQQPTPKQQQQQQQQRHQQQQQRHQQQQQRRHSRVVLLKLDVEGHEPEVIAGAVQLLGRQLVDNVLPEYAPHVTEINNMTRVCQWPTMLLQLLQAGFSLGHVADLNYLKRPLSTYSEPLHQLQSITETNLKFDLFDCMQLTEAGMTWLHEPCQEMVSYGLISEGIPERMHPKSFRSTFEANTHVWATREQRLAPHTRGPPVGVFPPDRKLSDSWFVEETSALDRAMGGRSCKNLREVADAEGLRDGARASFLISHRCRCEAAGSGNSSSSSSSSSACADLEQVADSCAQHGRTPYREEATYVAERR